MLRNAMVMALVAGAACTAMGQVRISQIYGAGGNTGSTFNRDFVELFNAGSAAVDLSTWSVQYASATGGNWIITNLSGSIAPGGYFLVEGAFGGGGPPPASNLPMAQAVGNTNLSATAGKVALVSSQIPLGTTAAPVTCPIANPTVVDFVGYGTANCREGVALSDNAQAPVSGAGGAGSSMFRRGNGCIDSNINGADFIVDLVFPRNADSPTLICPTFPDCNGNGIDDAIDIASGISVDCNGDAVPDECQLTTLSDCDGNGVLDSCQVAADPSLDCNQNGILDACDLRSGELTDVNGNLTPDACEGALVTEATLNSTVQPSIAAGQPGAPGGPRRGVNGLAFFNIQGIDNGTFASYGGLRFDISAAVAGFDSRFGVGNWTLTQAWLHLQQSNAAFTFDGPVEIFHSNNDAQVLDPAVQPPVSFFENFAADFSDRQSILSYTFTEVANGEREAYKLFDAAGGNTPGGDATGAELQSASGTLTLVLAPNAGSTSATYAGITNSAFRGPSLVLFAIEGGGACPCFADFDQSGGTPDGGDIDAYFNAWIAGDGGADADCSGGTPDGGDIDTFFSQWIQGGC